MSDYFRMDSLQSPRREKNQGYTKFLQDQVQRLNAVLREYQRKYPPIREPTIEDDEDALPPWLEDPSILSPLLAEYDGNIKALRDQVDFYKKEQEVLKEKADSIIQENNKLHQELQKSVENQLNALHEVEGISGVNQDVIDNLQHQMRSINQEKENYRGLWEKGTRELSTAQATLREKAHEIAGKMADIAALQDDLRKARKFAEDLQRNKHKLKIEQEQFLQTAENQERETELVRDELRRTKTELKTFKLRNEELSKHLDNLQMQIKLLDKDSQRAIGNERTSENTIRELENTIVELESRCSSMMKEIGKLRAEKGELEESILSMQKKNAELEDREYQATLHVRDSVQLVENALLEKEQASIKEQQLSQEVERLQESISNIVKEAEKKRRVESGNLRAHYNRQIERFMEEVHYLEMVLQPTEVSEDVSMFRDTKNFANVGKYELYDDFEDLHRKKAWIFEFYPEGAEKQAQLERALREKTAVERELEKAYREGPSEATRAGQSIEELQKRLTRIEVSRDDALQQADQLRSSIKTAESQAENEKTFLKSQIAESKKRIRTLEDEVETMGKSRLLLLEEVDKLKRDAILANQQNEEATMKAASEISSLKQKLEIQTKDFESRIKATENLSRQSVEELREMLTAQQRVGNKWRDESKIMAQKFESTVGELRQDNVRLQRKSEEVSKKFGNEQQRLERMERDLLTAKASQEKLQRMAADSEARADAASAQVQTLLNRERQLLHERKELNKRIDELELEASRPSRQKHGNSWIFGDDLSPEKDSYKFTTNGYYS